MKITRALSPTVSMTTLTAPLKVANRSRRVTMSSTACPTHPPYCRSSSTEMSTHCPAS